MFRIKPAARLLAALSVAVTIATIAPSVVAAQPQQTVAELRAQAKQVATELDRLGARSDQLDEAYLSARQELATLRDQLAEKQAAVAEAQSQLDDNTSAAKKYAIEAYVSGGDVDPILLPSHDVADASHRETFLASLHGDRTQAIDDVRAAQHRLADEQQALDAAKSKIEAKAASIDATQSQLRSTIARQTALRRSVDGQLAQAVAAEEARLTAQREAAAQRAARAAADRAARAASRHRSTIPRRATVLAAADDASDGSSRRDPGTFPDPGPVAPGAATAIAAARSQLGVPYRWGASSPGRAFDCSGLVMYAWGQAGVSLPHSSSAMFAMTQRISVDQLQPGDLVFGGSPVHHVGLYVGNGLMVHAPHTGDVVRVASIYGTSSPVRFGRL
jgi:cell wall-associated NlpC family hydrolase